MATEAHIGALQAAAEVHLWASALIHEMERYEAIFSEEQALRASATPPGTRSAEERELTIRRAAVGHWIFIAGNRLKMALRSELPRSVRAQAPSDELLGALALLRHFAEHPESRPTTEDQMQRFQRSYPTMFPGLMHWNREEGVTLGSVVRFSELRDAVRPLIDATREVNEEFHARMDRDGQVDPEAICDQFGGLN